MGSLDPDLAHQPRFLSQDRATDEITIDELAASTTLQSWENAQLPKGWRFSSRVPVSLVLLFLLIIIFVPWTQTVTVTGQMSAYTPHERPQDVEAQITGRIKKWHALEGDQVREGDLILELEDNDPNFMSPDLLAFLDQRKKALENTKSAALARVDQLDKRILEMRNLVKAAVPSAEARVVEAGSKVRQAHQQVEAAKIAAITAALNLERHKQLLKRGLVSQRELELAVQTDTASQADLEGAQANLRAAEEAMKSLGFGRDQVSAEMLQRLLDAEATRDASVAEAAKVADQLADVSLRRSNAEQRRLAGRILAPIDGTVVKMAKVGAGETVRQGDTLVRLSPTSTDKAIEMTADGLDAPLLNVGRKVKILFYGIPAIPLPAWPELMAGTYNGVIKVIDQVDDGKGNYRFWVVPDLDDRSWPEQSHVRQGTKVMGWVILNRVPLWYELWRRFNLFPPDYEERSHTIIDTLLPKAGRGSK
ncbi:MAG: HlyD family efflux transporter periplasmic adaptor subunit [Nitrospira sp.]|nr:HlyD family efflux transporter periplasmic adaptor subunit [Nitrospira sp.]MDH4244792.1 HlyD family efflux transporter periplasmic adaptor subunit [Nitrospira sp.]MDH4356091.1 HlyD family efflux transporter periplasmic adaptor subunit [Nitrospira sp.]MDH5318219.1 HlyD family efflux transporter periplasmic adaptor subunit [Nitrospira sp.]